ncbi:uncharacterized protein LOC125179382 [Hyalella azteca]|uniref:Uncharacterized protein LOC125179382 n=1 Tax=Hyalella azteca TaxID=294128 RepID=A0A979FXT8_HYAAZ|nr:uncharacterized protein LOC125179382 [Hyalella azteca]
MGCIPSLLSALRGYHGAHLTPRQVARQRRLRSSSRARQGPVRKDMSAPPSPEEDGDLRSFSFEAPASPGPSLRSKKASKGGGSLSPLPPSGTPRQKAPKFSFSGSRRKTQNVN